VGAASRTTKKPARKAAAKPRAAAAKTKKTPSAKRLVAPKVRPLDLSALPPESVVRSEKWICLACVLDVFTRHMQMALRPAWLEIRRYEPPAAELQAGTLERPYFAEPAGGRCPYCAAPAKWHARLAVARIESGKSSDTARRELIKSLPASGFLVVEEKATRRHAFFEWLEQVSAGLDFDQPVWLRDVSLHYLGRKEPKVNWLEQFASIHAIRRSRRLEEGSEEEAGRLFLAPMLFDELLLVQYLVSRSQKSGGLTLEGRYTLPELFTRLRNSGYLRHVGVESSNPSDALEALLEYLSGGDTSLRFYYIVDRRDYLAKAKALEGTKAPKPRAAAGPIG
jgi:hypothetical protein